jgi:large subunit ribosomal protein L19
MALGATLRHGSNISLTAVNHFTYYEKFDCIEFFWRSDMNKIELLEREQMRMDLPNFIAGDTVKVHVKIKEGEKERIQAFQGVVISKRKGTTGATFTVRKVSYGVGVERIFPIHSPAIDRVEIITRGRVRRGKLYYLRNLRGKAARIRERRDV